METTTKLNGVTSDQIDSAATLKHLSLVDSRTAQLSRALDYQAAALAAKDPFDACLGGATAGLIRTAIGLQEALEDAMAHGPNTLDRIARLLPTIDAHLRVVREIERLTKVERRGEESRREWTG